MNRFALVALLFLVPGVASAATLELVPASATVPVGGIVNSSVLISSSDQAMNAVSGTLTFSPSQFEVVSVSKAGSVLTLWVQDPAFSNSDGTVTFGGIVPNPGYQGSRGKVLSVTLRAKRAGQAVVSFSDSSVLANDGNGTNILTTALPASYTVTSSAPSPPATPVPAAPAIGPEVHITSSSHPDETRWYQATHAVLDWTNAPDVTAVKLSYDRDANGSPQVTYDEPLAHKELDLTDGIWYFHLREKTAAGLGRTAHYRIQIDTAPPTVPSISFPNGARTATTSIATRFVATDAESGVDHYALALDGRTQEISADKGKGDYALPVTTAGPHTLVVTVFDKAGNSSEADADFRADLPEAPPTLPLAWLSGIINYLSSGLIALAALAIIGFLGWYLWHSFHAFRRRYPGSLNHAHRVLREEFAGLQEAVIAEVSSLEGVRNKRELTREEGRIIANLKKLIKKTEFRVEDELAKAAASTD
jgi:hypothetical protein